MGVLRGHGGSGKAGVGILGLASFLLHALHSCQCESRARNPQCVQVRVHKCVWLPLPPTRNPSEADVPTSQGADIGIPSPRRSTTDAHRHTSSDTR